MKKIIFCLNNLDYGGIETAFINLCNEIDYLKYEVVVLLEKQEGVFLSKLNKNVKIINYNRSTNSNILIRKINNRLKLIKFLIFNYHQYDFAACYATSRKVGSILARYLSSNNCLWIHGNYYQNKLEGEKFLKYLKVLKFKKIVFVSNELKNNYLKLVKQTNQKLYTFNNLIDYKKIIALSNQLVIKKEKLTFCHIGRHKEDEKNIFFLLDAIKKLSLSKIDFLVYLIGDGINHQDYQKKVQELNLTKYVIFLGSLANPYPYLKISDALLLTSKLEGNPVVFLEAKVLNVPIITTDVSDSKEDINNSYGIVTNHSLEDYYLALKNFSSNKFIIKQKFDGQKYNQEIIKKIDKVIGD